MNRYTRPTASQKLDKTTRQQLLRDYYAHYAALAKTDPGALNVKLPREALATLLDEVGGRLLDEAENLVREPGPLRSLLDQNPLPAALQTHLPDSFRAFCLILNSLKQWIAAEQAATDRYFLGGRARDKCRAIASACVITGEALDERAELHHPVRDGRPPIYLSKAGHDFVEGQERSARSRSNATSIPTESTSANITANRGLMELVLGVKRSESWKQLRRGCLDHLKRDVEHSTVGVRQNARAFATRVKKETGLDFEQILAWMDENNLDPTV